MVASQSQLDILWNGYMQLTLNHGWRNDDFYMTIDYICDNLIFLKGLHNNPMEIKQNLKLDAIIKVYNNIQKYDQSKMAAGQQRNGRPDDKLKGLYGFVELMIVRSFYNTLKRLKYRRKLCVYGDTVAVTNINKNNNNNTTETEYGDNDLLSSLASIEIVDIDCKIDTERRIARAIVFERYLDTLEGKRVKAKR